MIHSILFYLISAILIFSAVMVVTKKSLFSCALYLAGTLAMVAALFVLLSADFLAAVQILLYVGGVVVIIVFAVMLSSAEQSRRRIQVNEQWIPSLLVCLALLTIILIGFNQNPFLGNPGVYAATTRSLGWLLLQDMKLPFEAVSLVLLASLVGAVIFSKKGED